MSDSYRMSVPCTREEGERLASDTDLLADFEPMPVIVTSEPDEATPEQWRLDVYFEGTPPDAARERIIAAVPSIAGRGDDITLEKVEEQDWVAQSQAGLEPVVTRRFYVHNSPDDLPAPEGLRAFHIGAGRAFGTGQHQTTTGCLRMIERVKGLGTRVDTLLDIGTGTGVLAFAAMHLWPRAYATASDIDPVSIEVAEENARANGVALGTRMGELTLVVAAGTDHPVLQRRGSYDLVIANILAGPLIDMAEDIGALVAPGGTLILAGLLDHQAGRVAAAYRRVGLRLADQILLGDWPTLRMKRRTGK